jgi:hypothetical protein
LFYGSKAADPREINEDCGILAANFSVKKLVEELLLAHTSLLTLVAIHQTSMGSTITV